MEVRAKKALGQHFLTDQSIARHIVDTLSSADPLSEDFATLIPPTPDGAGPSRSRSHGRLRSSESGSADDRVRDVLEIGPGMGVLTQYLLERDDIDLKAVELDGESVDYLLTHFPGLQGRLLQADFLRLSLERIFPGPFRVIGNFPYNISSQIFFKILDHKDRIPEVVGMVQKEVAERIAEKPGSKTYGILSVLLQAWYDIEYCFTVGSGAFSPPPKVQSAVIRLTRNSRTSLGCDEKLFKQVVKTAFNQRRKTLRNALKPLLPNSQALTQLDLVKSNQVKLDNMLELRAERLSVEDFAALTNAIGQITP